MDDEIVTLESYSDPFEAEWIKGRLEQEGIRVFQSGEAVNSLFPGISGAFGRVQLHVRTSDLAKAQCILQGLAEEDEAEDEPGAARNSSKAIQRPSKSEAPAEPETALQTERSPDGLDV